jgi:aspartate oxidase
MSAGPAAALAAAARNDEDKRFTRLASPRLSISSGVSHPDITDAKVALTDRKRAGDARTDSKPGSAQWQRSADVVVVGSGAAGISVALTAAALGLRVLVVTKDLVGGATPLAQGGLAAALGAGDTPAAHVRDTLVAGAGLCAPDVVAALARSAPAAIGWLAGLGARLETSDLRLEGGHSARRIVHSGNDATGAEVHRALLAALAASEVEILDRTVALDLRLSEPEARLARSPAAGRTAADEPEPPVRAGVTGRAGTGDGAGDGAGTGAGARVTSGTAAANAGPANALQPVPALPALPAGPNRAAGRGARPADSGAERAGGGPGRRAVTGLIAGTIGADGRLVPGVIAARAVVIAAGGLGQAFGTTSNPAGATGDGIAIAARAGAVIRDLEFVQFHPTVLWLPGASGQCPLITEALRGAGAVLRDAGGAPLMAGHDPRGDLAPRDVVAARMAEVIASAEAGHVWLDATALGRDRLENGFPTVTAACRKHGTDPVTDLIPVAPGAHYSCGGIRADLDGRTSVPGLYAAGEAASTGVQGANRLASNSVTEAVIVGRRTGTAIAAALSGEPGRPGSGAGAANERPYYSQAYSEAVSTFPGGSGLAQAMSRHAGVLRDADGLRELLRIIAEAGGPAGPGGRSGGEREAEHGTVRDGLDLDRVEAANLRTVSLLIAAGALRRAESRGCHRRRDAGGASPAPWHTLARWDGQELVLTEEAL